MQSDLSPAQTWCCGDRTGYATLRVHSHQAVLEEVGFGTVLLHVHEHDTEHQHSNIIACVRWGFKCGQKTTYEVWIKSCGKICRYLLDHRCQRTVHQCWDKMKKMFNIWKYGRALCKSGSSVKTRAGSGQVKMEQWECTPGEERGLGDNCALAQCEATGQSVSASHTGRHVRL